MGQASPPTPLCLRLLLSASPVSFLLPGDWQGQVGQKQVTQQVTEASRNNKTFFPLSHPLNLKPRDNMESVISRQVT